MDKWKEDEIMTITPEMQKKIRNLTKKGWGQRKIARKLEISREVVKKHQAIFREQDKKKIQNGLEKAKEKMQKSKEDEEKQKTKKDDKKEENTEKEEIPEGKKGRKTAVDTEVIFDSVEDKVRAMPGAIDDFIETERLKGVSKAEWEKRKQEILEMLRVEVDERIAGERQKALNKWWGKNSKYYVTKKDFDDKIEEKDGYIKTLTDTIQEKIEEKEAAIGNLTEKIEERETAIGNLQSDMTDLQSEMGILEHSNEILLNRNLELAEYNGELSDYIGLHIDAERERLKRLATSLEGKEESLKNKESGIEAYGKRQQDELDKIYLANSKEAEKREGEVEIREKAVEKREKQVDENKEKVDKIIEEIKEEQGKLKREWADFEKAVKKEKQQLQDWQTRLDGWEMRLKKTEGFNKFSRVCSFCKTAMFFDAADPKTDEKLNGIFGNYMHHECIKRKNQQMIPSSGSPKLVGVE